MVFPDDVLTNVYRLDNVSCVDWTVYENHEFTNNEKRQLQLSDNDGDDVPESQTHIFLEAAIALRKKGVHAIFDPIDTVIWTFLIHSAGVPGSDEKARDADIIELLALYGLTATSTGLITPNGLSKTSVPKLRSVSAPDVTQRCSIKSQNSNIQAFEANSSVKIESPVLIDVPQSSVPHYDDALIISRLTASISMSINFSICMDTRWLSLGMYSCIGPFQSRQPGEQNQYGDSSDTKVTILSIEAQWMLSGCLLIKNLASSPEGHRRLSDEVTNHGSMDIYWGLGVYLVPSGMKATIIATAIGQYDEAKEFITARLKRQDISVAADTVWVKLRQSGADNSDDASTFIWPATLCVSVTKRPEQDDQEGTQKGYVEVSKWIDPLRAAERWFLDGPARDQAVEIKRKAHRITAEAVPDIDESSDDERYFFEERISNGRLNLQDMSNVYPTPPDGAPLPQQSLPTQEQIRLKETADELSTTAEIHLSSASIAASPAFVQTPGDKIGGEPADLFGEIDSEMFAANGLTEDDFNFFDDQNADEIDFNASENGMPSQSLPIEENATGLALQDTDLYLDSDASCRVESSASVSDETFWIDHIVESQDYENRDLPVLQLGGPEPDNPGFTSGMVEANIPEGVHVLDFGSSVKKTTHFASEVHRSLDSTGGNPLRALKVEGFDQKYNESGRFGYHNVKTPQGDEPSRPLGEKNLTLLRLENMPDSVSTSGESDDASTDHDNTDASEKCPVDHVTEPADTHEHETPLNTSHKRKRELSTASDGPPTPSNSQPETLSPTANAEDTMQKFDDGLLVPSLPMPYPSLFQVLEDKDTQIHSQYVSRDPKTYLRVAQLLADQVPLQERESMSESSTALSSSVKSNSQLTKSQSDPFVSALYKNFPSITHCNLRHFVSMGKGHLDQTPSCSSQSLGKQLSAQSQVSSSQEELDQLFLIKTPLLRVQRIGTQMDISTSALPFWEELGLAPAAGEKNVIAFCICPESEFVEEQVIFLLESVRSAYQSHKLGTHQLGFGPAGHEGALIPVIPGSKDNESSLDELFDACENLGRKLATLKTEKTNFVIYMVNSSTDATRIPHLCEAFLRLSESYASAHRDQKMEITNDMSLHVLPLESIAFNKRIIIPTPAFHRNVAFEVYSRCAPLKLSDEVSPFFCAPAVLLARTIPRAINLQFTTTPVAGLPHSDRCIHVGYCWNPHTEWLSASWTDSQGSLQWSACYCVASSQHLRWPTLQEVARDVWDTTMDIISSNSVPWKVYIAKAGRMSKQELDVWLSLAMETIHGAFVTIVTIDEVATVQFTQHQESDFHPSVATIATPVSTPAANTVSPEHSGYVSTPGAAPISSSLRTPTAASFDHDNDARLVDITEEMWGVVTGIPSCNTDSVIPGSTTTFCAAVLSGYLVKRAGPRDQDGLLSLAVDIVHAQKANYGLMKDLLIVYRNLGTLARSRGNVDSVRGLLPCHIAIAKRAFSAVQSLMPWTED